MKTQTSSTHDQIKKNSSYKKIKPSHFFIGFVGISFLAAFIIGGIILGRSKTDKQDTHEKLTSNGLPSNPDEWQKYKIDEINMEISLPESLAKKGDWKERVIAASNKGSIVCFSNIDSESAICMGDTFFAGGTSTDFSEGREGAFTDLQGFTNENEKYFVKTTGGNKFELTNVKFREINNKNGVKIIKVLGENQVSEGSDLPAAGTPGKGYLGAVINTNNSKYPGIALQLKIGEDVPEYEFDQILESIKFSD